MNIYTCIEILTTFILDKHALRYVRNTNPSTNFLSFSLASAFTPYLFTDLTLVVSDSTYPYSQNNDTYYDPMNVNNTSDAEINQSAKSAVTNQLGWDADTYSGAEMPVEAISTTIKKLYTQGSYQGSPDSRMKVGSREEAIENAFVYILDPDSTASELNGTINSAYLIWGEMQTQYNEGNYTAARSSYNAFMEFVREIVQSISESWEDLDEEGVSAYYSHLRALEHRPMRGPVMMQVVGAPSLTDEETEAVRLISVDLMDLIFAIEDKYPALKM